MRRVLFALVLGASLAFGFLAVAVDAQVAEAQASCPPADIADFTDPVTGEIDFDAYFAALNCEVAGDDQDADALGLLARTGFNTSTLAALAVTLVVVGGALVLNRRRHVEA